MGQPGQLETIILDNVDNAKALKVCLGKGGERLSTYIGLPFGTS